MVDNFLTFFVAGQETTANTLAFCFIEIAKNKEILNKYSKLLLQKTLEFSIIYVN